MRIIIFMGIVVLCLFCISRCTDPSGTKKVLAIQGMTSVQITGYRWFRCGDDLYATGFKAIKNHQSVTGTVCRGWFKNSTIRYDS